MERRKVVYKGGAKRVVQSEVEIDMHGDRAGAMCLPS